MITKDDIMIISFDDLEDDIVEGVKTMLKECEGQDLEYQSTYLYNYVWTPLMEKKLHDMAETLSCRSDSVYIINKE